MRNCVACVSWVFLWCCFWSTHGEIFTSIGQMTDLIYTEKELVQSLREYIKAEESKLAAVKSWASKLDALTRLSTSDPEGYLAHPVNAYKLMKRLNTEWSELETLVLQNPSDAFSPFDVVWQKESVELQTEKSRRDVSRAIPALAAEWKYLLCSFAQKFLSPMNH